MNQSNRRNFLVRSGSVAAGLSFTGRSLGSARQSATARKFTLDLTWGAIGVSTNQRQAIEYAATYGFESVYADPGYLTSIDDSQRTDLAAEMKDQGVQWGAAGLPLNYRQDEAAFREGLKSLPKSARALEASGVKRVSTWLRPAHSDLTYLANFRLHARRLRECAKILGGHGLRFGMEYIGPRTLWASQRHTFIHTLTETMELIAEMGEPNVGVVLDSWHWYTAHESADDLRQLRNSDIVACDLNDAPADIPIDQQIDNQRELPAATGVIDLKAFLQVLLDVGYDGPVRAEPFNAALNAMDNETACKATAESLRRALGTLAS